MLRCIFLFLSCMIANTNLHFKIISSLTHKLIVSIIFSTVVVQGCGHRTAFLPYRHVFLDASGRMAPIFSHHQSFQHSKEEFPQEILYIGIWWGSVLNRELNFCLFIALISLTSFQIPNRVQPFSVSFAIISLNPASFSVSWKINDR